MKHMLSVKWTIVTLLILGLFLFIGIIFPQPRNDVKPAADLYDESRWTDSRYARLADDCVLIISDSTPMYRLKGDECNLLITADKNGNLKAEIYKKQNGFFYDWFEVPAEYSVILLPNHRHHSTPTNNKII